MASSAASPVLSATLLGLFIAGWYTSTSFFSVFAKQTLQVINDIPEDDTGMSRAFLCVVLTTLQVTIAYFIYLIAWLTRISAKIKEWQGSVVDQGATSSTSRVGAIFHVANTLRVAGLFYFTGNLTNNLTMLGASVSTTNIYKAMEPLFVLAALAYVSPHRFFKEATPTSTFWLIVLIVGVVTGAGKANTDNGPGVETIISAMVSNVCFSMGAVLAKVQSDLHTIDAFGMCMKMGMFVGLTITVLGLIIRPSNLLLVGATVFNDKNGFLSGVGYGLYKFFSFIVLSSVANTTHSVLKIGKRICSLAIAGLYLHDQLTAVQWIGVWVAMCAIIMFEYSKQQGEKGSVPIVAYVRNVPWKSLAALSAVVVVGCFAANSRVPVPSVPSVPPALSVPTVPSVPSAPESSLVSSRQPRRYIALVGPHDRYNFGDLIFGKVVRSLFVKRRGYFDEEILDVGMIDVDMERYGGPKKVLSYKTAMEMSVKSTRSHESTAPYDLVILGGQAGGCKWACGIHMLMTEEQKEWAKANKAAECAYVVAKERFVPKEYTGSPNVGIYNSMGGMSRCEGYKNIDYWSTRDLPAGIKRGERIGAPDSAVMTNVVLHDQVTNQTTFGEVARILRETNGTYVSVQWRARNLKEDTDIERVARWLDLVSARTKMPVVFFCAGTAPGHDDMKLYKKVVDKMTHKAFVMEDANTFSVIALISRAKLSLSTSLHVRIMAFAHNVPRVTIHCSDKHTNFMQHYDHTGIKYCPKTDDEFEKAIEEALNEDQEKSRESVAEAVENYLSSFDQWSQLFVRRYNDLPDLPSTANH